MLLFIHQQVTLAMLALTLAALVGDVYKVTSQHSYFESIFMFPLFFTEDDVVIDEMSGVPECPSSQKSYCFSWSGCRFWFWFGHVLSCLFQIY